MRGQVRELSALIDDHVDYEQQALVPLLRDADCWGRIRAERLLEQHASQREAFDAIELPWFEGDGHLDPSVMQRSLASILGGLDIEERELFPPEVLHDDPIVADQATE